MPDYHGELLHDVIVVIIADRAIDIALALLVISNVIGSLVGTLMFSGVRTFETLHEGGKVYLGRPPRDYTYPKKTTTSFFHKFDW